MRPSRLLAVCLLLLPTRLPAGETVDYARDVKPILKGRCYACHGALKQKAKLRLDTGVLVRKGGRHGPAVVPGKAAESLLIERVADPDEISRMPPEGKPLTPHQIAVLKAWIDQGAKSPPDEEPEEDPSKHWAFRKPVRPAVPRVKDAGWVRNPIDAFVAAEHGKRGLTPSPPLDRGLLLRRIYLGLIGVPPTREQLHAFLADHSADAYEKVVDVLLASPAYAQRWGRHWMDVWRYSDWYGSRYINELRYGRRHIWRWRDWIIDSVAADKGYDRMALEMLAGDELAPGDRDVQRASGFLGRNFYVFNRHVWLQDTVEYTAGAFLALTFKCCRCHDHKYDPFAQEDYYRLRAFFEPHRVRTDPIAGRRDKLKGNIAMGSPPGSDLEHGHDCVYDADLAAPTFLLERGNEMNPVKDRPIAPGVPEILGPGGLRIQPVALPVQAFYPELRPEVCELALQEARTAVRKAEAEFTQAKDALGKKRLALARAQLAALEARIVAERAKYEQPYPADPKVKDLALAAGNAERLAALRQAELDLHQAERQLAAAQATAKPGDAKSSQTVAAAQKKAGDLKAKMTQARKAAESPSAGYTPLGPVYPPTSTGRRLALARWIASRDNPLTARVAVNQVWLRHIGQALVPSVANFGRNGKRPTHPALLDWLAVELMENGWSTRRLHRLIVTSQTYRTASSDRGRDDPNCAIDPENRYLWRAPVRRMEAEVVRDSLLHLAGQLDFAAGGPDLDPNTADTSRRRSLYFRTTPDEKALLMEVFDAANPSECYERQTSVMPHQALALVNGSLSQAQARLIARRLDRHSEGDSAFVTAAFEHVLTRLPTAEERAKCEAFLKRQFDRLAQPAKLTPFAAGAVSAVPPAAAPSARARENLVHVLLNYNEFVTVR